MYTSTITLTASDVAPGGAMLSVAALIISAAAIPASFGKSVEKLKNVAWFKVYGETANDIDATNGAARIAFDNRCSRVVATAHGLPVIGGLQALDFPSAGIAGLYDFNNTFINGKVGDVFQIVWGKL